MVYYLNAEDWQEQDLAICGSIVSLDQEKEKGTSLIDIAPKETGWSYSLDLVGTARTSRARRLALTVWHPLPHRPVRDGYCPAAVSTHDSLNPYGTLE